jgi:hypothetical protein
LKGYDAAISERETSQQVERNGRNAPATGYTSETPGRRLLRLAR